MENLGDLGPALNALEEAVRLDPGNVKIHVARSMLLIKLRQRTRALDDLELVSDKLDLMPATLTLKGQLEVELRLFKQASESFSRALVALPENSSLHVQLAYVFEGMGKLDEALDHIEAAIELGESDPRLVATRAYLLQQTQKWDEALEAYTEAIALEPANASYFTCRGHVALQLGLNTVASVDFG